MSLMVVVEGRTDEPVVRKLAGDAGLQVAEVLPMRGKDKLDLRLDGFNAAANGSPWFVLRDLDHDAECAPSYLRNLNLHAAPWMVFRLAMREMESWLLADREGLAQFLSVSASRIAERPDDLDDPKQALVNIARFSKKRAIVQALVPKKGDSAPVGPLYETALIEFSSSHWDLKRASKRSPSLRRARKALLELARRWSRQVRGNR